MEKWQPHAGDLIYHVCEFGLDACEIRKKGLEGFKSWGYEVVQSRIVDGYTWRSKNGSATPGWASEVTKRDVGRVTETNRMFYWKENDFGTRAFLTEAEAIQQAEKQIKLAYAALHETRADQPMYRNWLHWDKEKNVDPIEEDAKPLKEADKMPENITVKKTVRATRQRKTTLPESLYIKWRDGEITAAAGARELGITDMTFAKYAKEMLMQRGENHVVIEHKLPENFEAMYKKWKKGKISMADGARACGITYSSFQYQAQKRAKQASKAKKA